MRCNFKKQKVKFETIERAGYNTASGMYALQPSTIMTEAMITAVTIPQAVCMRCNLQITRITGKFPRLQYRKRYVCVATAMKKGEKSWDLVTIPQAVCMCCNSMSGNPPPDWAEMSDLENLGRILPVFSTFEQNTIKHPRLKVLQVRNSCGF